MTGTAVFVAALFWLALLVSYPSDRTLIGQAGIGVSVFVWMIGRVNRMSREAGAVVQANVRRIVAERELGVLPGQAAQELPPTGEVIATAPTTSAVAGRRRSSPRKRSKSRRQREAEEDAALMAELKRLLAARPRLVVSRQTTPAIGATEAPVPGDQREADRRRKRFRLVHPIRQPRRVPASTR